MGARRQRYRPGLAFPAMRIVTPGLIVSIVPAQRLGVRMEGWRQRRLAGEKTLFNLA